MEYVTDAETQQGLEMNCLYAEITDLWELEKARMYCDDWRSRTLKSRFEHQLQIKIKQDTHEFNEQAEQGKMASFSRSMS